MKLQVHEEPDGWKGAVASTQPRARETCFVTPMNTIATKNLLAASSRTMQRREHACGRGAELYVAQLGVTCSGVLPPLKIQNLRHGNLMPYTPCLNAFPVTDRSGAVSAAQKTSAGQRRAEPGRLLPAVDFVKVKAGNSIPPDKPRGWVLSLKGFPAECQAFGIPACCVN